MRTIVLASSLLGVACSSSRPATPPVTSAPAEPTPPVAAEPAEALADKPILELRMAAVNAYNTKDWAGCARDFDAVLEHPQADGDDAYNGACCHARAGHAEFAFDRLDRAAQLGVRDVDHLEADADLNSLHEHSRWAETVALYQTNHDAYFASINIEFYEMFQADQLDRSRASAGEIEWDEVSVRDAQRLARAVQMVEAGEAKASDDWYHAAMIMQHGDTDDDYRRAHEWALRAAELTPTHPQARWLAAAAKDRWLLNQGKPQLYGTQFIRNGDRWELYEVDPSVTDEERARWDVPPLSQAKRRAELMNQ